MSKQYTIIVHTIAEDGLPPRDLEKAGLTGRTAFIFDGSIYCGWPSYDEDEEQPEDPDEVFWEDGETAKRFMGIKKWIELPAPGWKL